MAVLLTTGANLGETKLEGQVVVLDVDSMDFAAPTKARPWFKVNIVAALGVEGAPDMKDVRWLMRGSRLFVVLELPEGTIGDVEPIEESKSAD